MIGAIAIPMSTSECFLCMNWHVYIRISVNLYGSCVY